jgi:two-component system, NtrC family, sensor kinase
VLTLPDEFPIIIILAVLVGIFVSVQKDSPSPRVKIWTYAWALAFLHFFARVFETHTGLPEKLIEGVDLASVQLSGIVFLSSVAFEDDERSKRIKFSALLAIPVLLHPLFFTLAWGLPWAPAGSIALIFLGTAAFFLRDVRRHPLFASSTALVLVLVGALSVRQEVLQRDPWFASAEILAMAFGLTGVLFWRIYRRPSLGVIASTAGFIGWGAVYPLGALLQTFAPNFNPRLDFWNIPRILVALGMVLTLLEDQSLMVKQSSARAQAENLLLQRLSQITSRLLAGSDPHALCGEAVCAITEASSFRRAAIFLAGEGLTLNLSGSDGFTPREVKELQQRAGCHGLDSVKRSCAEGSQLGGNSYRISETDDLVLIPLVSWRGSHVGCLYVSGAKAPGRTDASEMVKLEVFASDLAVTFENMKLHQQLVRSEKLAALGQLVAGVAHELNNPLTGILGYSDLLAGEAGDEKSAKRVEKLGNEARRMKRIVDGLLRFGRQNTSRARLSVVSAALRDVLDLREYDLRKRSIHVEVHVEPALPPVKIAEDELKQVLLNILNNAIDAVWESEQKEIAIRAAVRSECVVIEFQDSGPGFTDKIRAFDPFYTTKPVGKGTGLGLSICYGIVQECGGEITLANKTPDGACVMVEVPVAVAEAPQDSATLALQA